MTSAPEASTLTETLLGIIRYQRHVGSRTLISTQEPSISPKLLDLCSLTFVHRFTSPEWFRCLRDHLAALDDITESGSSNLKHVFKAIVYLEVGEALVFGPSASVEGRIRMEITRSSVWVWIIFASEYALVLHRMEGRAKWGAERCDVCLQSLGVMKTIWELSIEPVRHKHV